MPNELLRRRKKTNDNSILLTPTLPRRELGSLYCETRCRMISLWNVSASCVRQAFLKKKQSTMKWEDEKKTRLYRTDRRVHPSTPTYKSSIRTAYTFDCWCNRMNECMYDRIDNIDWSSMNMRASERERSIYLLKTKENDDKHNQTYNQNDGDHHFNLSFC